MKNDYLGHKKLKKFQVLFYSRVVSSWAFSAEITEQGLDVFLSYQPRFLPKYLTTTSSKSLFWLNNAFLGPETPSQRLSSSYRIEQVSKQQASPHNYANLKWPLRLPFSPFHDKISWIWVISNGNGTQNLSLLRRPCKPLVGQIFRVIQR